MRTGKLEGQWEVNSTEFMMQALARAFASVCERLRAGSGILIYLFLRKLNMNSWTVDAREAGGMTGAGHECAAEEKAGLASRAMVCGASIWIYYLIEITGCPD